ncbi:formylglycine-generating enzyme family protein [Magnetococcales bacterium HHB-1]
MASFFSDDSKTPSQKKRIEPITGMELIWIPGGRFMMGQTEAEKEQFIDKMGQEIYQYWFGDELPRHEVALDGFWLGKYPVTQAEWQKVMGKNPSFFQGARHPVEQISWSDTQEFIQKLNNHDGENRFRLPTEAEWEYSCRAGSNSPFFFGESLCAKTEANYDGSWPDKDGKGSFREETTAVGSFQANAFGLYDMHGNVWEWVEDLYAKDAYHHHQRKNPIYTSSSNNRLVRGGSWFDDAAGQRCAYRHDVPNDFHDFDIGCRLARTR